MSRDKWCNQRRHHLANSNWRSATPRAKEAESAHRVLAVGQPSFDPIRLPSLPLSFHHCLHRRLDRREVRSGKVQRMTFSAQGFLQFGRQRYGPGYDFTAQFLPQFCGGLLEVLDVALGVPDMGSGYVVRAFAPRLLGLLVS